MKRKCKCFVDIFVPQNELFQEWKFFVGPENNPFVLFNKDGHLLIRTIYTHRTFPIQTETILYNVNLIHIMDICAIDIFHSFTEDFFEVLKFII